MPSKDYDVPNMVGIKETYYTHYPADVVSLLQGQQPGSLVQVAMAIAPAAAAAPITIVGPVAPPTKVMSLAELQTKRHAAFMHAPVGTSPYSAKVRIAPGGQGRADWRQHKAHSMIARALFCSGLCLCGLVVQLMPSAVLASTETSGRRYGAASPSCT